MIAVVLLSALSAVDPGSALEQIAHRDPPGGLVVTVFLLLVIVVWSIHGGLSHRRAAQVG